MLDDLRYAVRQLVKNPSFTVIAVFALVLGQGMTLIGIGIGIGLIGAIAAGRALMSLLYNVGAIDAGAVITAVISLVLVALIACCVPARRATRVDPIVALRTE